MATVGDIVRLYMLVTIAILEAERGGADRWYPVVTRLEELIARGFESDNSEGLIARYGAVHAAIKGRDPIRALRLACRYLSDPRFARFDASAKHGEIPAMACVRDHLVVGVLAARDWQPVELRGRQLLTP